MLREVRVLARVAENHSSPMLSNLVADRSSKFELPAGSQTKLDSVANGASGPSGRSNSCHRRKAHAGKLGHRLQNGGHDFQTPDKRYRLRGRYPTLFVYVVCHRPSLQRMCREAGGRAKRPAHHWRTGAREVGGPSSGTIYPSHLYGQMPGKKDVRFRLEADIAARNVPLGQSFGRPHKAKPSPANQEGSITGVVASRGHCSSVCPTAPKRDANTHPAENCRSARLTRQWDAKKSPTPFAVPSYGDNLFTILC
jgi:hypothetical protein